MQVVHVDPLRARSGIQHQGHAALDAQRQRLRQAARTDLPASQVRAILDTRPPVDANEFRQRIARLIDLRKRL